MFVVVCVCCVLLISVCLSLLWFVVRWLLLVGGYGLLLYVVVVRC